MKLKARITKVEYDTLNDAVKASYKQGSAGDESNYILDVDGLEDAGELRRANERNKDEAKKAKDKADALALELEELRRTGSRNSGDIVALEKSWKETAENQVNAEKGKTKAIKGKLAKLLVTDVANRIANKISKDPELLLPHIEKRLRAEIPEGDDDPLTRVLDSEGKPSALTVAQLEQEFVANSRFASIIIGSKASGGGASGNQSSGGATKKPSEYTGKERTELYNSDRATYEKLFPTVN